MALVSVSHQQMSQLQRRAMKQDLKTPLN